MKVFVAGGTGVIGARAMRRLVEAGHAVTAIARSAEKAEQLRGLGATPVRVSLFDRDALTAAVAGHDAVVNLATRIPSLTEAAKPGAWKENERIRSEGSANLVDAAIAAGAGRYVQESICFAYRDGGDGWIDATTAELDLSPFVAAVGDAEASAARFTAAGGTGVVLRFGMFYAPESSHTRAFAEAGRAGVAVVVGRPDAYKPMIHADDAAAAVVAALDVPAGTYDVVDDEPLTNHQIAQVYGGHVRLPGSLAAAGGAYGRMMTASQRVSNRRFKEATGWAPAHRSLRDGWPSVVQAIPRRSLSARLVRPILFVLALSALQLGLWASLAPASFYEDFPGGGRTWVAVDGPYNEHLVRDFGGLHLALTALFVGALLRPERHIVRTAAVAALLFAAPHLAYHAANLDVYDTSDQVLNTVLLGMAVVLPGILLLGSAARPAPASTVRAAWAPPGSSSPPSSAPSPG